MGPVGAELRRLYPHHGRAAQARRTAFVCHAAGPRLHLQGLLYRPVLRLRRGLCGRASGDGLPGLRAHDRDGERGELFLQALGLRAQAAGVLRGQPRFYGAGVDAARGDFFCARRAEGSVGEPDEFFVGHSRARRREARDLRLAGRAGQLHYGAWLWVRRSKRPGAVSKSSGRRTCT